MFASDYYFYCYYYNIKKYKVFFPLFIYLKLFQWLFYKDLLQNLSQYSFAYILFVEFVNIITYSCTVGNNKKIIS